MSKELKPCPFCGASNVAIIEQEKIYICKCKMCGVSTRPVVKDYSTKAEATEQLTDLWNARANESQYESINNKLLCIYKELRQAKRDIQNDIANKGLLYNENDENNEDDDVANHIVTMNGKYANSGLTIQQIYEKDAQWIEFISTKSRSRHIDVEKIKKFYTNLNLNP
jgi:Lar family restriction alleviation protein